MGQFQAPLRQIVPGNKLPWDPPDAPSIVAASSGQRAPLSSATAPGAFSLIYGRSGDPNITGPKTETLGTA